MDRTPKSAMEAAEEARVPPFPFFAAMASMMRRKREEALAKERSAHAAEEGNAQAERRARWAEEDHMARRKEAASAEEVGAQALGKEQAEEARAQKALDRPLVGSMAEFMEQLPVVTEWKQLLQLRYPQVPPDMIKTHLQFNNVHQSPLGLLCPPAGYTVEPWNPDITDWPNNTDHPVKTNLLPYEPLLVGRAVTLPLGPRCVFRQLHTLAGMCRPEGAIAARLETRETPARAVIILDMVRLPDKLDVVLNRLFHYMELTGVMYGAATCYSSTWLCKRKGPESRLLQVSPPHDMLCMAIGYLAYRSLTDVPSRTVPPQPVASFDMAPALDLLSRVCDKLQVEHKDKILSGVDVSGSFRLEDLENVKRIDYGLVQPKPRVVLRAQYCGKQVVVKTRDLTSPYHIGYAGMLATFVGEVDAHFTLKNIESRFIPKLHSWGFVRGAMFVYTITEDVGISTTVAQRSKSGDRELLRDPERLAALPTALEALLEIHKRGLLHGDIDKDKLVTRKDDAGKWKVMLVGFGQSSRAEVFSKEWSEGMRKENAALQEAIEIEESALKLKTMHGRRSSLPDFLF